MVKIGIVGGTGYTGVELLRILASHPDADVRAITSRGDAGTHLEFEIPARGLIGLRSRILTATQGEAILPDGWVQEAGSPQRVGAAEVPYGYMWWPMEAAAGTVHEGAFRAIGIFGQTLYIHPRRQLVIAQTSALPKPMNIAPIPPESFFGAVAALC